MGLRAQNLRVVEPVLAFCRLCLPILFKEVGAPYWVPHWGTGDMQRHAETFRGTRSLQHAWIAHPWIGMSSIPTALWIFFCLPKSLVNLSGLEWSQHIQWSHHFSHVCIAVHSPWLPGNMGVAHTVPSILTMAGLFLDRPCSLFFRLIFVNFAPDQQT